jgi:hypothetical protein
LFDRSAEGGPPYSPGDMFEKAGGVPFVVHSLLSVSHILFDSGLVLVARSQRLSNSAHRLVDLGLWLAALSHVPF